MDLSGDARRLCWHGVLLFFLGLVNGAAVGAFTNPRLALSAHLAGVQNGMALLLFGLLWSNLVWRGARSGLAAWAAIASMYAIWLALLLGALFGTSRATPIAGSGFAGEPWQELLVTGLLYAGSVGILAAVVMMLLAFRQPADG